MEEKKTNVPIWKKYSLNFTEAAEYFGIGKKRLRQIISENPHEDFVLEVGSHVRIKRQKFTEFLDMADVV